MGYSLNVTVETAIQYFEELRKIPLSYKASFYKNRNVVLVVTPKPLIFLTNPNASSIHLKMFADSVKSQDIGKGLSYT